jgi:hypothetical protein
MAVMGDSYNGRFGRKMSRTLDDLNNGRVGQSTNRPKFRTLFKGRDSAEVSGQ